MTSPKQTVEIVGAGLAGALLGLLLARRGFAVNLYDRRPDPRHSRVERGRSINLALAARGIRALERAGIMSQIRPLMIPMRGRMIHELNGATALQLYGHCESEVIYSIDRGALNRVLIDAAAAHVGVNFFWEHTCLGVDPATGQLRFRNASSARELIVAAAPAIATDGAGSAVRASLADSGQVTAREDWLDHDYKELSIPDLDGRHVLDTNALHIWPRGGFMLIALPNTDGSFTATLFLARNGANSFATLDAPRAVQEFFQRELPDIVPLIPDLAAQFTTNPPGRLATVHTNPWFAGQILLLGDAAHAIVPFHGQGMNAAFEDCWVLDEYLAQRCGARTSSPVEHSRGAFRSATQWSEIFAEFTQTRRPNTAAIAAMALENYTEMRDTVLDPGYVRRKSLAVELEKRFPDRFIPRYSMVMFHPEIQYAEAQRRGAIQEEILRQLTSDLHPRQAVDFAAAEKLLTARLPPIA